MELHLLFPDICMGKLIWLGREDEEAASSLRVMKNCKFFFWIWVLQLFWQHYTHPLSCRVSCCLQWQHRCWNWTAWWLSGNVSTEPWHSFTKGLKHGRAPDQTKQKPSWLPAPGLDCHRAALHMCSVREFRLRPWALIQMLVQCFSLLRCSHWLYYSVLSFPFLLFLFLQIPSSSCGFRKKQVDLRRYHRYFGKPVACITMNVCDFYLLATSSPL